MRALILLQILVRLKPPMTGKEIRKAIGYDLNILNMPIKELLDLNVDQVLTIIEGEEKVSEE